LRYLIDQLCRPRKNQLILNYWKIDIVVGFCGHYTENHLIWTIVVPGPEAWYSQSYDRSNREHHQEIIIRQQTTRAESREEIWELSERVFSTVYMNTAFTYCVLGYALSFCLRSYHQPSWALSLYADLFHRPDDRALRRHTLYPSTLCLYLCAASSTSSTSYS
jgi:hypothetical protein